MSDILSVTFVILITWTTAKKSLKIPDVVVRAVNQRTDNTIAILLMPLFADLLSDALYMK
jgi:hypothetical protein